MGSSHYLNSNCLGGGVLQVKTILSEEGNAVVHLLPPGYDYVVTEDAGNCLTIRCSILSAEEVGPWLEKFEKKSFTKWISWRTTTEPMRFILRRQLFCQHSSLNKGKYRSSKSTNCKSKLDIKIKKMTLDTRKKDEFLRLSPPLPTIIKLSYIHNHSIDYVVQREAFLQNFQNTQQELKNEIVRLSSLVSKNKLGHSAMLQFLREIKKIKTEAELFHSMRKIRLKANYLSKIGRPPKIRADNINSMNNSEEMDGRAFVIYNNEELDEDKYETYDESQVIMEVDESQLNSQAQILSDGRPIDIIFI